MQTNSNNQTKPRHSRATRILALILSILVAGGALTVILQLIFNIFG